MSHEIHIDEKGKASMAFTGPRSAIWHGLGQELNPDASMDEWRVSAGMDFVVKESVVHFLGESDAQSTFPSSGSAFGLGSQPTNIYPDRKVLYRSDNGNPLSIVGSDFKVMQPGEVLGFFEDLVKVHGMTLSTAGVLFGGKRFWALAEMCGSGDVVPGDQIKKHLLLTTSVDGGMATTAKVVGTRVVCNNTMTLAMGEQSSSIVKVTHKKMFDPDAVKLDLGLIDKKWSEMMASLKKMAETKISAKQTMEFFQDLYFDPKKLVHDQLPSVQRQVAKIAELAHSGSGSDMSRGTLWGALSGATEFFTHGTGRRDASNQFWESYHGTANAEKLKVFNKLRSLVAA